MFIIAARPSMGKTSFLLNIIEHIALNEKSLLCSFPVKCPQSKLWNAFFCPLRSPQPGNHQERQPHPA